MNIARLLFVGLVAASASCSSGGDAAKSASKDAPVSAPAPQSSSAAPAAQALPQGSFPCGTLKCEAFDTPQAAFLHVLDSDKPLVLALGESHALKGATAVKSTTARFTEDFLPTLEGKASSLVLELWVADGKCGKKKEKEVADKQKVVTENQAEENQNEFVKLGEKSKALAIVPFILKPTCEDYETIRRAGDDAPLEMLSMITRVMREKATTLYKETDKKKPGKIVVTYGGAMHNDRAPKAGREGWSFAADLDKLSNGRYVELDLIVPEFIKDTESWKSLPWYGAYDVDRFKASTILITMGPRAYALVFPRTQGG